MLKLSTGRIKTCILIILIISSLILSGSLWFENYHGFSVFFSRIGDMTFSKFMSIGKGDIQSKYDRIFVPSQIIVNNGEDGHWVLYGSGKKRDEIWESARGILRNVLFPQKGLKIESVQKAEWDSLLGRRSILISFQYPLSQEISSLLFPYDDKRINEAVIDTEEIAITITGQNLILYTRNNKDNQSIYQKFYLNEKDCIKEEYFENIFTDQTMIKYALLKEAFKNLELKLTYGDKVFGPIFSFSESRRSTVKFKEVEFKPHLNMDDAEQINKFVERFFQGGDYAKFIKNDGTHIFIDEKNNTLKIYSDSLVELELKNESAAGREAMNFENALKIAINTIEKFGGMSNLYITDIDRNREQYTFKFNYTINGIPVICNRGNITPEIQDAVEITISKEQIKCKRFIEDYKILEEEYSMTSDYDSIINALFETIGSNKASIKIEDIKLVYESRGEKRAAEVPVWLIKYEVNDKKTWMTVKAVKDRS